MGHRDMDPDPYKFSALFRARRPKEENLVQNGAAQSGQGADTLWEPLGCFKSFCIGCIPSETT